MVRNLYKTKRRRMMKSKATIAKRGRKVVDDIVITGPSSSLKIITNTYSTSPYKLYMKYKCQQ